MLPQLAEKSPAVRALLSVAAFSLIASFSVVPLAHGQETAYGGMAAPEGVEPSPMLGEEEIIQPQIDEEDEGGPRKKGLIINIQPTPSFIYTPTLMCCDVGSGAPVCPMVVNLPVNSVCECSGRFGYGLTCIR